MHLYRHDNFLKRKRVSGDQNSIIYLLREIEVSRLNGLLEIHVAGEDFSVDARALVLRGLLVVIDAFTAFNDFHGYQAVKLLKMVSLDEDKVRYWVEFRVLRHEEIMAELEEMDSESVLEGPLRPMELLA